MSEEKNDKQRFAELSWKILEHKYRYYILNSPVIQDFEYDMIEKEYEALAMKLKLEPSASNMVDFDTKRPSCMQVMRKLGYSKKRRKR